MELKVLHNTGEDTNKKILLSENIFNIIPNDHALYLDIKNFLINQRQGTHKVKGRSEVVGSTKKIKKQKGTGTARAGSIKSPIFRGGGKIFGPSPRDYRFKVNKKIKLLAKKSALTYKAKENNITIIEDFNFSSYKTKDYLTILKNLSLLQFKTLLIISEFQKNIIFSNRNIKNSNIITVNQINTYDIINAEKLLISENSLNKINKKIF
jgi:large subunit ribosomal protein L4